MTIFQVGRIPIAAPTSLDCACDCFMLCTPAENCYCINRQSSWRANISRLPTQPATHCRYNGWLRVLQVIA